MIENLILAIRPKSEDLKRGNIWFKTLLLIEIFGEAGPQVILQLYVFTSSEWTEGNRILRK